MDRTDTIPSPEITRAIMLGAAAGGCRFWARKDLKARPGLLRAAENYGRAASEALSRACAMKAD